MNNNLVSESGTNYMYRGVWGGHKVGMITTQGESACSRQQAETPTRC